MKKKLLTIREILTQKNFIFYLLKYGVSNLYTGERVDGTLEQESIVTLFYHSDDSDDYYDLLDNRVCCKKIGEEENTLEHGCRNLQSIRSLLESGNKKGGIGHDTKTKRLQ